MSAERRCTRSQLRGSRSPRPRTDEADALSAAWMESSSGARRLRGGTGCAHVRLAPAAAHRLVEARRGLQSVELDLRELILRGEERALGVQDREQVVGRGAVADLGEALRFARLRLHVLLE